MKLSILICTMSTRKIFLHRLMKLLLRQVKGQDVEILVSELPDNCSIGEKRNSLLNKAVGDYVCYIDDDDVVTNDYIQLILGAMATNPDVITFEGFMTTNGRFTANFVIKLGEDYNQRNGVYYRFPNHLTVIKSEIAKAFPFKHISHGEDYDWACRIKEANMLNTSEHINSKIYHYDYRTKK